MRIRLSALTRAVQWCAVALFAAAVPAAANTTYTNLTTAPVAGNSVLILDSSVAGGVSSLEATEALNLGFDVVVNDNPTWLSMSTAQFATFRAIILGDPYCQGSTAPIGAAIGNRTTWSPAVQGNMIIIGTDETLHAESSLGAKDRGLNLTRRGIAFAANNPAKTGAFISLSCYYSGAPLAPQVLPLLDQYGTFTLHGSLNCYNNAHIVATAPALTGASVGAPPVPLLLDGSLANWSCSLHEGFDSWPAAFSVFAIGQGLTSVYTATDGTKGLPYILVTGEKVQVNTNISLTPNTASNPVNTTHTLTATISPAPPAGTVVTFTCTSGPNAGVLGTALTNAFGVATLTYTDTGGAGTDFIIAQWTDPATGATYTSNTAQKTWNPCTVPDFSITGPATACGQGTYCVTPAVTGANYSWSVSNGTIVGPSNGPCVVINWNSPAGGVVTVCVQIPSLPGTPPCAERCKEIFIKPCDIVPKDCCDGVTFTTDVKGPVAGPSGSATVTPYLGVASGLGNITRVVATIVATDRVFSSPACGISGPVNSYFLGWGFSPGFNASLPIINGREMIWSSIPPAGVNLAAASPFPFSIQLPPPPAWPCSDAIKFCVRYEFTDINCKTCEVTVCYTLKRKGSLPYWDPHLVTGVIGYPLPVQPLISVRDPDGNIVKGQTGTVTLSIVRGTGAEGAQLLGKTTVPFVNGIAKFSGISIDKAGAGYLLRATMSDDPDEDDVAISNPFNILLVGGIPIYHRVAPTMLMDGNITAGEWNGAPLIPLGSFAQNLGPGPWSGTDDYSSNVQFKWDEDYLYFAARVTDDALNFSPPVSNGDPAGRDALDIFLGTSEDQDNLERMTYDAPGDYQVRISANEDDATGALTALWYSPQAPGTISGPTDNVAVVHTGTGYTIEGRLPWSLVPGPGFAAAPGTAIGFDLESRDYDKATPVFLNRMSLTGLDGASVKPNSWTLAFLLGAPPALGDVNGDGAVDALDVQITAGIAGGLMDLHAPGLIPANADLDANGVVDLRDALRIDWLIH
jgi:hypothetical protein